MSVLSIMEKHPMSQAGPFLVSLGITVLIVATLFCLVALIHPLVYPRDDRLDKH